MKVLNSRLLKLAQTWDEENAAKLKERLGKTETDLIQVYKLFQINNLVAEFFPQNLFEYNKLVCEYQNDNSDSLEDVLNGYKIAEYKAFKEILAKAGK